MAAQPGGSGAGSRTATRSRPAQSTATLASGCVNPIRLRGFYQRIAADTGEVLATIGTPGTADGVLVVSCKDRRASCCPACSQLYRKDAYQLIATGLRGGKNIPATVGTHPAVMLTLTAPSFGAVHGNRDHGQPCRCGQHHDPEDPRLGTPIDAGRYRYREQVIWNHCAPELWKRTIQALRRGLAQALGTPRSKLSQLARVRFAKVAEFQRRGVVHYHAIIRIDGPDGPDTPGPAACTTSLLEQIAAAAIEAAAVALPEPLLNELPASTPTTMRWGAQRQVVALDHHTGTEAAGYIAKYATKATETATGGTVIKPIRSRRQIDQLKLTDHARALIATAWVIGERAGYEGLKRWAQQFGYGGHTLTKSHHYSLTFAALRAARADWRRATNGEGDVIVRTRLVYAGRGHWHGHTLPTGAGYPKAQRPALAEGKP